MATLTQQEKIFTIPASWTPACLLALPASARQPTHALMDKVEALENAKRCAAASYARLAAGHPNGSSEEATLDEQEVLCARVNVLNALLLAQVGGCQAPLCLTAGGTGPRVCVTYDRSRCEGDMELGPMQSTMAWAVPGAEEAFIGLLAAPHHENHAIGLAGLLARVRDAAPRKDILQGLHATLELAPPDSLALKRVHSSMHDPYTRVSEGTGAASKGPAALYRVVWGALDLDVLEGWQNPSTNAAIRLSIIDAVHSSRDTPSPAQHAWTNAAYLQVRILRGEECHTLTLRPFWDSESCTVSHIQFAQPVFDVRGPERGILNLSHDPSSVAPIRQGAILPLKGYVCIGAHRKSRLSEAQLNYVHAQGLLAHGFDTRLLPNPASILAAPPGTMLPAKATRVSGDRLDVMASSFRVGDQVHTTISIVQYPPFGTQFERPLGTHRKPGVQKPYRLMAQMKPRLGAGDSEASDNEQGTDASSTFDWEQEQHVEDDDDDDEHPLNYYPEQRRSRYDDPNVPPLYKKKREYSSVMANRKAKKCELWDVDLADREHFFVDGVFGDTTDENKRFIWFEIDHGKRYKEAEQLATEIRDYFRHNFPGNLWMRDQCLYYNIDHNTSIGLDGHTAQYIWSFQWQHFITQKVLEINTENVLVHHSQEGDIKTFWYTPQSDLWLQLLDKNSNELGYSRIYKIASQRLFEYFKEGECIANSCLPKTTSLTSKLPLPQAKLTARAGKQTNSHGGDPAVTQLQSRVAALETRLGRARQDENTQFLLTQVLERLDSGTEENV